MKNKSNLTLYILLFTICTSLLSFGKLTAQENNIFELNQSNALAKKTSKSTQSNDRVDFYSLTYKLHPTIYINNGIKKENNTNKAEITKLTFNDLQSFDVLNKFDSAFNNVELITITLKEVDDLNSKLDLTNLKGFGNLKYIYVTCNFECTENQIKEFINSNSNIRVFYKNEIPS